MSIHGEDDRQRIKVETGRCKLMIDMDGQIQFLEDETGVAGLSRRAHLEIEEKLDGVRRRVEFRPGADGRPEIRWELNGKTADYDAAAREWVALMIPQIFRMTGIQAEERVGRFLASGGPAAVFEEIELIQGDRVQRLYFVQLMEQVDLTQQQAGRWLRMAGAEIGSDYELAETLAVLPAGELASPEIQEAFVVAAGSIGSDYEMRRTLQRLLSQERLSTTVLDPLLAAAKTIGSDYECTELLVAIARQVPAGDPLPTSYYEVAASIGSDYEMRRALSQVAERPMGEEALSSVLAAAREIGSDYELAELLVELIRRQGVPAGVRADYEAAVETIGSRYERDRVLDAWKRHEGSSGR